MRLHPVHFLSDIGYVKVLVLWRLLLSVCINDLPLFIKARCDLFADNTTIHNSYPDLKKKMVRATIVESINCLIEWTEFNHKSLHPDKTKCMLTTTTTKIKFNFEIPTYIHRNLSR